MRTTGHGYMPYKIVFVEDFKVASPTAKIMTKLS